MRHWHKVADGWESGAWFIMQLGKLFVVLYRGEPYGRYHNLNAAKNAA